MLCLEQTVGPAARQRAPSSNAAKPCVSSCVERNRGQNGQPSARRWLSPASRMADALKGASAALLLNPPPVSGDPYARTEELGAALADAARRAHLPKVVALSSIGAQHASGTGVIATLNRFEALLDGVAPTTAFPRSGYFVETWSEVAETVMSEGVLPTFLEPSQKIPMVSTIDVGRAAAALLCEDWTGKPVVELGGPEDWSAGDVAAAFAEVLGRPIKSVFVPSEQRAALLSREGVPAEVANALLGMYVGIANGLFTRKSDSEHRRGTKASCTVIAVIGRIQMRSESDALDVP
jgi:uncharacterized protein YbjT (DUF2867 family)